MNITPKITVAKKGNFYAVYVDGKEVRCLGSRKVANEVAQSILAKSNEPTAAQVAAMDSTMGAL